MTKPFSAFRPMDYNKLEELNDEDNVIVSLSALRELLSDVEVYVALNTTAHNNYDMHWVNEKDLNKILKDENHLKTFEDAIEHSKATGRDNWTEIFKRRVTKARTDKITSKLLSLASTPLKTHQ